MNPCNYIASLSFLKSNLDSFIILFFSLVCISVNAQFNFNVAYELEYIHSKMNKEIVQDYNDTRTWLDDGSTLKPLNFVHGLSTGVSYKAGVTRYEIGYRRLSRTITSKGYNPIEKSNFQNSVYFTGNSIFGSIELLVDNLGFGTAYSYGIRKNKVFDIESDSKLSLEKQNFSTARIFLIFETEGSNTFRFSVKPFVQYNLLAWDHVSYAQYLEASIPVMKDNPISFGLSLVFYNGPKD